MCRVTHAFTCIELCVYNVHFCVCMCVCRGTDIVKDGWLGRRYMCLCVPGEPCSATVLTGWGVSEHLSQGHLQHSIGLDRLTPLSDLCLVLHWAPQALPLLASVCVSPLGKILSGLVYKKAVGGTYVTLHTDFWKSAIQPSNSIKPPSWFKLNHSGCSLRQMLKQGFACRKM